MITQPQKTKSWKRIRKRAAKFRQDRISEHVRDQSLLFEKCFLVDHDPSVVGLIAAIKSHFL